MRERNNYGERAYIVVEEVQIQNAIIAVFKLHDITAEEDGFAGLEHFDNNIFHNAGLGVDVYYEVNHRQFVTITCVLT